MKQKYGVFAEESGEVRLIHEGSVRFSRANRFALRVFGKNVFFSHYDPEKKPVGERHRPKHIEAPDWSRRPGRPTELLTKLDKELVKHDERKRRPKRRQTHSLDYAAVDPITGQTLGDVMVDMHRERLLREARNA